MYSSDQTQRLQNLSTELLSRVKSNGLEKDRLEDLRDVLRFHEYRYAILNDPLISDFEYDTLYKELEKLERQYPELVSVDSPTQRVANQLTKDFPTTSTGTAKLTSMSLDSSSGIRKSFSAIVIN